MRTIALACLLMSTPAFADVAALKNQIQIGDDARADEAAKKLAVDKDPKALEAVLDLLALGIPPRQAEQLLAGLSGRHDARSIEVLTSFTKNRNAELRRRAIELLGGLNDPRVVATLLAALSDGTAEVRAEAAGALARRKERTAEPKLLQLLARRDEAAPAAIAAIATPELAHRLSEMIGPIPDALLCDTFGQILKRPDFGPDAVRVEIVKTLSKIPSDASTAALMDYLQATAADPKRPSRMEAESIVTRRKGS
jgi:HEAT repeat protein